MTGIYNNNLRQAKDFNLHADHWRWAPDPKGALDAWQGVQQQDLGEVIARFGDGQNMRPALKVRRAYRRRKPVFTDVVAILAVVEALVDTQRGIYIRAPYLVQHLNETSPLYFWTSSSIGRILSGLEAACGEYYRDLSHKDILTQKQIPFAKGRDSKGQYYVTDPMGGNEGLLWLLSVRLYLVEQVNELMMNESVGQWSEKGIDGESGGWTSANNLYVEKFEGTKVRSTTNYMAQWEPGQRFKPPASGQRLLTNDPLE